MADYQRGCKSSSKVLFVVSLMLWLAAMPVAVGVTGFIAYRTGQEVGVELGRRYLSPKDLYVTQPLSTLDDWEREHHHWLIDGWKKE